MNKRDYKKSYDRIEPCEVGKINHNPTLCLIRFTYSKNQNKQARHRCQKAPRSFLTSRVPSWRFRLKSVQSLSEPSSPTDRNSRYATISQGAKLWYLFDRSEEGFSSILSDLVPEAGIEPATLSLEGLYRTNLYFLVQLLVKPVYRELHPNLLICNPFKDA